MVGPVRNSLSARPDQTLLNRWCMASRVIRPGFTNPHARGGFLRLKTFLLSPCPPASHFSGCADGFPSLLRRGCPRVWGHLVGGLCMFPQSVHVFRWSRSRILLKVLLVGLSRVRNFPPTHQKFSIDAQPKSPWSTDRQPDTT